MMKRIFAVLLALAMLLSVSAVFAENETATEPETAVEMPPVPDTLLVTVCDQEIRENDATLQKYISSIEDQLGASDGDLKRVAQMAALNYLLQDTMLRDKATKNGPIDEVALRESAEKEWENLLEMVMSQVIGITDDSSEEDKTAARADAISYIETNAGYTEESYVEMYVNSKPLNEAYNNIIEELKATRSDLVATDEDIQAAYNDVVNEEKEAIGDDIQMYLFYQNVYDYGFHYTPEGYRGIIHILLDVDEELLNNWKDLTARYEETQESAENTESTADTESDEVPAVTEEPVTAEMVEAAYKAILDSKKETLDKINAELEAGTAFEDLIAKYGTDPGMKVEENLKNGYSLHPEAIGLDGFDSNFAQAAAALEKVGDISAPFVTQFGIHILKYLRDVPGSVMDMTDEEREDLRESIESERLDLAFSEYFDAWLASSDVVWTTEGESWKYDEGFINDVLYGTDEDLEEDETEEEAEPTAEPAAEEEAAAEPEETPAP